MRICDVADTFREFLVHSIMIQHLHRLQNDPHNDLTSIITVTKYFFLVRRTFKIYSPSGFQIHNPVLLAVVTKLRITSS